MKRGGRLRQRSEGMQQIYDDERIPLVIRLLAERKRCEIRWDRDCTRRSVDIHEKLSRGRGGSITDESNCVATCRYCHEQVGRFPAEAERRGWLAPSGRPAKAVPRPGAGITESEEITDGT